MILKSKPILSNPGIGSLRVDFSDKDTAQNSELTDTLGQNARKVQIAQKKKYEPPVWFLSSDLKESAKWLTNKQLDKSIKNSIQLLVCCKLWYSGIRSPRTFRHYFPTLSKDDDDYESKKETIIENMGNYFPGLYDECKQFKIKSALMRHSTMKWAKMCREHCAMLCDYLAIMLEEWRERFRGKTHKIEGAGFWFIEWFEMSDCFPVANLKPEDNVPDWKQIPPKFRNVDIYAGFRSYYSSKIENPVEEYENSNREIPDFVLGASKALYQ